MQSCIFPCDWRTQTSVIGQLLQMAWNDVHMGWKIERHVKIVAIISCILSGYEIVNHVGSKYKLFLSLHVEQQDLNNVEVQLSKAMRIACSMTGTGSFMNCSLLLIQMNRVRLYKYRRSPTLNLHIQVSKQWKPSRFIL